MVLLLFFYQLSSCQEVFVEIVWRAICSFRSMNSCNLEGLLPLPQVATTLDLDFDLDLPLAAIFGPDGLYFCLMISVIDVSNERWFLLIYSSDFFQISDLFVACWTEGERFCSSMDALESQSQLLY